jgi:hypothetical protein
LIGRCVGAKLRIQYDLIEWSEIRIHAQFAGWSGENGSP